MRLIGKHISLIFLCVAFAISHAHAMRHLTTTDGLSNKQTFSIVYDRKGFIWVSTRNGVDRFSGSDFKSYRLLNAQGDDVAGRTNTVISAPDTLPCVYTNNGDVFRYAPCHDRFNLVVSFSDILQLTDLYVNSVTYTNENTIFVCHSSGLLRYNIASGKVDTITSMSGISVNSLIPLNNNDYAIATGNGFYLCSITSLFDTIHLHSLPHQRIQALCYDPLSERLFIGAFDGQLYSLDLPTRHVAVLYDAGACIRHITLYDRALWLATDGHGVARLALDQPRTAFYDKLRQQLTDCPAHTYYLLIVDKRLWVATRGSGLCYFDAEQPAFKSYPAPFNEPGKNDKTLNTILEDHYGSVWIAGNQGICKIDRQGNKYFVLNNGVNNNIMALCEDRYGNIWAGGSNNATCIAIDEKTCQVKHHLSFPADKPKSRTYCLFSDSKGQVWAGGYGSLLTAFDPIAYTFTQYPVKYVNCIAEQEGVIYAGTTNGLMALNPHNKDSAGFINLLESANLSANLRCINHIHPAPDGSLWLSTEGGLINFNNKQHSLTIYSTDIGLLSNSICASILDAKGRLWLSSNKGLQCLIPQTKQVFSYTETEGLADENFKNRFAQRLQSGELIFGTATHITLFDPELITPAKISANIVISSISINGQNDSTNIADNVTQITIPQNPNQHFSITINCINYSLPNKVQLRWKLIDYDSDWQMGEENGALSYSHVPHGKHTLLIQAINTLTGETLDTREISIHVRRNINTVPWLVALVCILTLVLIVCVIGINTRNKEQGQRTKDKEPTINDTSAKTDYVSSVQPTIPLDNDFIKRVSLLLDSNIDNSEYTIDQLAADMAMSRSSFFTKLKAISGVGPNDFIRTYRLQHAAQMLREHKYSITEVAYDSGFNDVKYFSTVFKKHFGVSPSKFK